MTKFIFVLALLSTIVGLIVVFFNLDFGFRLIAGGFVLYLYAGNRHRKKLIDFYKNELYNSQQEIEIAQHDASFWKNMSDYYKDKLNCLTIAKKNTT